MSDSVQFKWGSVSITGNFRENNEDNYCVDSTARYFLVADGMGGQSAGEKASELAIEIVSKRLDQSLSNACSTPEKEVTRQIDQAVEQANSEIMALGEIEPNFKNMGTTITFIVVVDSDLYIGGVGDSRAYQLRNETLEQLTEDHSLTQALVNAGTISPEDAKTHRYKNVLYRYLGSKDGGTGTEAKRIKPQIGDRYVLCSDGVSDGASDDTIHRVLAEHDDPQEAAEALVKAAQDGGSKDNITCVIVHVLKK
ncbi:PP2C family protein-serine/threonine phosphatase [Thalassoglobus polymorphus]|uniref:Serine/threonine phosphatase stp n=1 Tax=Thalassoglobus polymorphus TaxID=2527994 RepID=A0A517QS50_9PLAN|nr:protein phosphatase 2C domain-containing protein [Thalassoglobus polymorphus]QDT34435.1 Serine/threonine phosphatase stp [Thalassoglobus polymorphus]